MSQDVNWNYDVPLPVTLFLENYYMSNGLIFEIIIWKDEDIDGVRYTFTKIIVAYSRVGEWTNVEEN